LTGNGSAWRSRAARAALAAAACLVVLVVLAGCGGSSGGPSLSGAVTVPRGYSTYRGPGFSLISPAGWRQTPYRTDATHRGTSFVPPGPTPADAAYPLIETELSSPRSSFPPVQDFANFIADLRDEPTTVLPSGQPLADKVTVAAAKVPGASEAKLVTVLGPGPRHETDLLTLTSEGVIKVKVAWYPANEPVDPTAVIDSFRLRG
jgi:hypothetical protein